MIPPKTIKKQPFTLFPKTMKKQQIKSSLVEHLPHDLVVKILASVASSSIYDLLNTKLVCKEFCDAAQDKHVFQKASMENFAAMRWRTSSQADSFMKQCQACGNSDALFRQGMMEYFSTARIGPGIDLLRQASDLGLVDATYMLGIILLSSKSEASRNEGVKLLEKAESKKRGEIRKCRARSRKILGEMWINNVVLRHESACTNPECRNGGRRGFPGPKQWSWTAPADDWRREKKFCSESCKWDHHLYLFCNDLIGIY